MNTMKNFEVNTQAFAGASQRREEILLPLARALCELSKGGGSEAAHLAQLALYQAATAASLKGRADKGLVDLARMAAKLPVTQLGLATFKVIDSNKGVSEKELMPKIATKMAGLARHALALEDSGFEIVNVCNSLQIEEKLTAQLKAENEAA